MRKRRPRGKCKLNCSKCDKPLEEDRVGKYRYCKSCHAEHMRNYRPKHKDLSPEQKQKAKCRAKTKQAISRGTIEVYACQVCDDCNSQVHHPDYKKFRQVVWLCRKHHLLLHKGVKLEIKEKDKCILLKPLIERIRKPRGQRKDTCSKCESKKENKNKRYCNNCSANYMRERRKNQKNE